MTEIRIMTSETSWVAAKAEARKAIYDTGRGMIGRERNYLEDRVARAILAAEKRAEALLAETRKKALEEAGGWQPIETAPKDGKEFLAAFGCGDGDTPPPLVLAWNPEGLCWVAVGLEVGRSKWVERWRRTSPRSRSR
jgi:hypothetical protein